jgi:SAM-dependent methyltransferase
VHEGTLTPSLATALGTFDVVLYADVLEHLVDPLSELKKAAQFLAPDGVMIISVPNVAHWSVRVNMLRGRFNYAPTGIMDATHLRWFTSRTLLQLLKRAGFAPVHVKHSAGFSLPCYQNTMLSRIPTRLRHAAIRRLIKFAPTLFACQFVMVLEQQDLTPSR